MHKLSFRHFATNPHLLAIPTDLVLPFAGPDDAVLPLLVRVRVGQAVERVSSCFAGSEYDTLRQLVVQEMMTGIEQVIDACRVGARKDVQAMNAALAFVRRVYSNDLSTVTYPLTRGKVASNAALALFETLAVLQGR